MDQQRPPTKIDEKRSVVIDYISNLPIELRGIVVAHALSSGEGIKPSELCEYLLVSHLWHETILQHIHALQVVSESSDDLGKNEYVLKRMAPKIASLHVRYDAIPAFLLLQQACFTSLTSLSLQYEYVSHAHVMCGRKRLTYMQNRSYLEDRATVLSSLATVQSTLTHLKVMMGEWDWDDLPPYSIGDLLTTFPHLVSLSCGNIYSQFDAAPTTCPTLRELKLAHFQYAFDSDDIDDLTCRLPSLEVLGLHPCDDIAALSMVQDNCPKLKFIVYNDCGHRPIFIQRITYKGATSEEDDDGDDGLQLLKVDQGCEEHLLDGHIVDVITSITRNSHSLQSLHLRYRSSANITDHHSMYGGLTFSHLTSYTHDIFNDEDMILAMGLIRRSPLLVIIELHKGHPQYHDHNDSARSIPSSHRCDDLSQVFTIMSGLPHLEVADVQIKGDNATTGVEQFLCTMVLLIPSCVNFIFQNPFTFRSRHWIA